jgi:hypothetical protein
VSYGLAGIGLGLTTPRWRLVEWIGQHTDEILTAQDRHDQAERSS